MTIFHRFTNGSVDNNTGFMMCSDDQYKVDHFGRNHYSIDITGLNIMTAEDLMSRAQARVDYLEIEGDIWVEGLNPHDIVDSAGSWDCLDTVQWLFDQGVIPCDVDGVVTQDGFICFRSDLFTAH